MLISKGSAEMLLKLVEGTISCMDVLDVRDVRDLQTLQRCREELRAAIEETDLGEDLSLHADAARRIH